MTEARHQSVVDQFGKYIEIRPVVMKDYPDARMVRLTVASQSFVLSPDGCENLEEAEWVRDMACIALSKIVAAENPPANSRRDGR